jgi:hypothetical protein
VRTVWRSDDPVSSVEAAPASVKQMYHDDRVLRVFIVTDEAPPTFVEWAER